MHEHEDDADEAAHEAADGRGHGGLFLDAEETSPWEQIAPRAVSAEQRARFEAYIAEIFEALGMDLRTPTPNAAALPAGAVRLNGRL